MRMAAMLCFAKYFVIRFQTCHEASFIVGFLELLMFHSPLVVTCLLQPLDLSTLPFVNKRELITIDRLPKLSWAKYTMAYRDFWDWKKVALTEFLTK